jgi:hypothetical protein
MALSFSLTLIPAGSYAVLPLCSCSHPICSAMASAICMPSLCLGGPCRHWQEGHHTQPLALIIIIILITTPISIWTTRIVNTNIRVDIATGPDTLYRRTSCCPNSQWPEQTALLPVFLSKRSKFGICTGMSKWDPNSNELKWINGSAPFNNN